MGVLWHSQTMYDLLLILKLFNAIKPNLHRTRATLRISYTIHRTLTLRILYIVVSHTACCSVCHSRCKDYRKYCSRHMPTTIHVCRNRSPVV